MRRALLLAAVTLAACVRPPVALDGQFFGTSVLDAQRADHTGERVRWGGIIVKTAPAADETCIEVVSLPLDRRARPRRTDQSFGRFLACAPGFYDPEIYAPRREVTAVGALEGTRQGKVEDYDYLFPIVQAETIHLWPDRQLEERDVYYGVGVGPSWYPYWWGWWSPAPYYYRPPIVHRRR